MRIRTKDPQVFAQALKTGAQQIPFAMSNAINDTAKRIQEYQRRYMNMVFEVRRASFVNRAVKIKPFAKKTLPVAVLKVEPPGGPARANVITRHERGGDRRPTSGRALSVPIEARRTKAGVVRKNERPRAFAFNRAYSSMRTRSEVYLGNRRTFMVRKADGSGFIAQRTGAGRTGTREGIRVLYALKTRTPVPARLQFVENARFVFDREFTSIFAMAYTRAIQTARPAR